MIAPLRKRHRVLTLIVAVAAPALFFVAIAARAPVPAMEAEQLAGLDRRVQRHEIPDYTYEQPAHREFAATWWSGEPLTTGGAVEWRWDGRFIGVRRMARVLAPDLLVYLAAGPHDVGLPSDAVLLGAFDGVGEQYFELPGLPVPSGSRALLYSLAHAEVVATWDLGGMATSESVGD